VGLVVALAGTIGIAASLQVIYEKAFDHANRGMRDIHRFVAWTGVLCLTLVADSLISQVLHSGAPSLLVRAVLTVAGATAFLLWTMHLLLAGRTPWRELVRPAIATALLWIAVELFASVYFSSSVITDSRLYGTIGVVFDLLTWFILIGVVIVLGAVGGAVWQDRHARLAA
jgi:membrane protein